MPSPQVSIALAVLQAFDDVDLAYLDKTLSNEGFTFYILPYTINKNLPGNKAQYLERIAGKPGVIAELGFQTPHEIIEGKDVVVLHVSSKGKLVSGAPYTNEYIFIFRFDGENDNKIVELKEFVDSKYTLDSGILPST